MQTSGGAELDYFEFVERVSLLTEISRYVQGIKSNSKHLGSYADSATLRSSETLAPPGPVRLEDWYSPEVIKSLGGGANPSSTVAADAVWALRDHMIKDSLKLDNYLGRFN